MSAFLDTLKERLAESQAQLHRAQALLAHAQTAHAAATQEYNSWANAVNVETRREQAAQQPQEGGPSKVLTGATTPNIGNQASQEAVTSNGHAAEINKTQLIREVLQQHPAGIKPVGVWIQVKDRIARPYVYSVLSRMKEKKQVNEKRGKYFLVPIPKAEDPEQTGGATMEQ